jgi:hypothetical protein
VDSAKPTIPRLVRSLTQIKRRNFSLTDAKLAEFVLDAPEMRDQSSAIAAGAAVILPPGRTQSFQQIELALFEFESHFTLAFSACAKIRCR